MGGMDLGELVSGFFGELGLVVRVVVCPRV